MKDNLIRRDYCKSSIAIFWRRGWPGALERRYPPPNESVMILARQLGFAPPPPTPSLQPVAMVATIFSMLIRGPIGRRHRIYYNLQRIFRWGSPPTPAPSPSCIIERYAAVYYRAGDCVGKKRSGVEREGRLSVGRRRWQWNEPAVERETRWTYEEKKERRRVGREKISRERDRE